jgi:DNA processing protein
MTMSFPEYQPSDLLGPLNEVEEKNAPKSLFAAGDTGILEAGARVSIVGARKASPEGIRRAKKLGSLLARRGIVVVSGLAEGIDTAAHEGAISHGGRTIGVIGTPLDEVFPKKNTELQLRMMREQLVISQFPVGYPTQKKNFPLRNRTMALISDASVIIEASDTSGSLSQGWENLRLGRHLFITKSVAENPSLKWPEQMMHYGARVLSDESLEEFFDLLPVRMAAHFDGGIPF